jgi:chorismate mutase
MAVELKFDIHEVYGSSGEKKAPIVIAGPCSAESEEQVLQTARALKNVGIKIFRAGIWKPRTRPKGFEGHGAPALSWLKLVKAETGMLITTEVANREHVEASLAAGVDILWIGARTTANPFAVQEIAEALQGTNVTVLIKNPVNPDADLWMGAIERVYNCGIKNIVGIHRGFSKYGIKTYRNDPQWQIPIEMKRRLPNLPIITDPSHICGKREYLAEVAQKAYDLCFDGLMIETHINPDSALTDRDQQITPDSLGNLLRSLMQRNQDLDSRSAYAIESFRSRIDSIAEEIARIKKLNNVAILQAKRWGQVLDSRIAHGLQHGVDRSVMKNLMELIHEESINHQEKILILESIERHIGD